MTAPLGRVGVAGHLCLDIVPTLDTRLPPAGGLSEAGPLELRLGGSVANTGLALASLGAPVDLAATVGDDILGSLTHDLIRARAQEAGETNTIRMEVSSLRTSYSVVLEPLSEDRRFLHFTGANDAFDGTSVSVDTIVALHVGYPQLLPRMLDRGGAALSRLLDRARSAGCTTSVDFASVDPGAAVEHPWTELVRSWLPRIDIATPSVDDLAPAYPGEETGSGLARAIELAGRLVEDGAAIALVTAGPHGMALRTSSSRRLANAGRLAAKLDADWMDRRLAIPGALVPAVMTSGAGDTATAALLFGMLAGLTPERTLLLATSAAAIHVSGAKSLPRWTPDFPYSRVATTSPPLPDWTTDEEGVLHGPTDGGPSA